MALNIFRFELEANHEGVVLVDHDGGQFIHFGGGLLENILVVSNYIRINDPDADDFIGVRTTGYGLALAYLLRALGHDVITHYKFYDL
jgi:hypothetical protein